MWEKVTMLRVVLFLLDKVHAVGEGFMYPHAQPAHSIHSPDPEQTIEWYGEGSTALGR